ncbi:hypothetical protein [Chitinophaga rhizosphaerae]|uniref:hypothetical protein n=1 Tax=Chitinophaga rhizosphaerae TaxID=1864947 RepID=UPI000F810720|nr:hypothetical protein [Chitinophaga rhizosphaerae]
MRSILFLFLAIGVVAGCKSRKKTISEDDRALTFADYANKFPPAEALRWNADSLKRKRTDSLAFKSRYLKQFLPDTLAKGVYGAAEKPRFWPVGQVALTEDLRLFVVEGAAKSGAAAWMCFYDKNGTFLKRHLAAQYAASGNKKTGFSVDKKGNIRVTTETGAAIAREDVFAANPDGSLALILTNSNEPAVTGLFNPIDTLPRKHKFSGNYTAGEGNIVSIRDGETAKEFLFFIHFTRDKGACTGEIDGTGRFTSATTGQWRDKQSGCIVDFKFSGSKVTISETGCGAYRGIKCAFEGTFTKKRK